MYVQYYNYVFDLEAIFRIKSYGAEMKHDIFLTHFTVITD